MKSLYSKRRGFFHKPLAQIYYFFSTYIYALYLIPQLHESYNILIPQLTG